MLNPRQREQVIACCRELVRAQSLAGRERPAAEVAERWMMKLGYDEVWVDDFGSVVGRVVGKAGDGPHIHFDGHLDTVPATAIEHWQHAPYGAEMDDNAIWGRGSTDMKGPLAAMICAAAFAPRHQLRGTVTVSASVAEEELEGPALCAILKQHGADMVVIGESTLLRVGIAQKGRAGIWVTTQGRPAHSSVPHMGDNAVYRMLEPVQRLQGLELPTDDVLGQGVIELVEIVSSPYPGTSIVPDRCRVRWDRRLVRGETRDSVLNHVRDALTDMQQVEVAYMDVSVPCYTGATIRSDDFHPAWDIPETDPLVQTALRSLAEVGEVARTCTVPYCTNGSGSAGELNIPTIVLGPGDPALLHVIDEHITLDQLMRGTEVYIDLILSL
jgi:putative selenium metabolism hydrolase